MNYRYVENVKNQNIIDWTFVSYHKWCHNMQSWKLHYIYIYKIYVDYSFWDDIFVYV